MPLPPGPLGLPVIGDSVALYRDPYGYGQRRFATYGPISKARLLGKPAVMLLSAEGQRFVLVNAQRSLDTGAGYAILTLSPHAYGRFSVHPRQRPSESPKGLPGPLNIPSRVLIPVEHQSTIGAHMRSDGETVLDSFPTATTVLAGIGGRHRNHSTASVYCFAFEDGPNCAQPASLMLLAT
jgi:hypothetical protein